LRQHHSTELQATMNDLFSPLNTDEIAPGLSVLENALFGKIAGAAGSKGDDLRRLVGDVLIENGAQKLVVQLIYDVPVALSGANLPAIFAEPLSFTRASIKRPDVLIMDQVLASYDDEMQKLVYKNLQTLLPDTTLIYLSDNIENEDLFDAYFEVQQGRLVSDDQQEQGADDSVASADLARKVRALEQTDMFSGLNRKQLRLLAFGARWYEAPAGEVVFLKDDDPTDGAYMILEGGRAIPAKTRRRRGAVYHYSWTRHAGWRTGPDPQRTPRS